jgi:hypothetical protein
MNAVAPLSATAADEPRRRAVFINCPFDTKFQPLLDTLIFVVVCCDFEPRSAVEDLAGSTPRMLRIVQRLRDSQLSIHDLSRFKGERPRYLARWNMPLELGMAIEMKHAHERKEAPFSHDWLALAPDDLPERMVVSDLNGYDIDRYADRPRLASKTIYWLRARRRELGLPDPRLARAAALAAVDEFVDHELVAGRDANADPLDLWNETVGLAQARREALVADQDVGAGR